MSKRLTTADFIYRAVQVHGNLYNYEQVRYQGMHEPVTIICPKHGPFSQEARVHLRGSRCPACASETITRPGLQLRSDLLARYPALRQVQSAMNAVDRFLDELFRPLDAVLAAMGLDFMAPDTPPANVPDASKKDISAKDEENKLEENDVLTDPVFAEWSDIPDLPVYNTETADVQEDNNWAKNIRRFLEGLTT